MLLAETAATPSSSLAAEGDPPPAFGLVTTLQLVPSQCSISVWPVDSELLTGRVASPTAQALFGAKATTDVRKGSRPGDGADTTLQAVPFQCRISVWSEVERPALPTAQTSVLEVPETLERWALRGIGLGTTTQLVPLKCSIRLVPPAAPTAQTSPSGVAVTAFNVPAAATLGVGTIFHFVPSQCSMSGPVLFPTAHTLVLDTAATLKSWPAVPEGKLGVGTTLQLVPLKCSTSGVSRLVLVLRKEPTAQTSLGLLGTAEVALRPAFGTFGLVTKWRPVTSDNRVRPSSTSSTGRRRGAVWRAAGRGRDTRRNTLQREESMAQLLEINREQGMNGRGFHLARTRRLTVSSRPRAASSESRPFDIEEGSPGRTVTRIRGKLRGTRKWVAPSAIRQLRQPAGELPRVDVLLRGPHDRVDPDTLLSRMPELLVHHRREFLAEHGGRQEADAHRLGDALAIAAGKGDENLWLRCRHRSRRARSWRAVPS